MTAKAGEQPLQRAGFSFSLKVTLIVDLWTFPTAAHVCSFIYQCIPAAAWSLYTADAHYCFIRVDWTSWLVGLKGGSLSLAVCPSRNKKARSGGKYKLDHLLPDHLQCFSHAGCENCKFVLLCCWNVSLSVWFELLQHPVVSCLDSGVKLVMPLTEQMLLFDVIQEVRPAVVWTDRTQAPASPCLPIRMYHKHSACLNTDWGNLKLPWASIRWGGIRVRQRRRFSVLPPPSQSPLGWAPE